MSKHLRAILLGLVLGTFGLFSCSERSLTASASDDTMSGFGKAVVQLPDLSSSALSKLPAGVDSNALTLLIVASDMDTMKYSWPVISLKGQKVEIDGIPSGANRYFEGFLTNKSGVLTHTGKVAVRIIAGQDVPVNLKLSGVGGADVCIEIEGYPSACNSDDSLIINTCLKGTTPEVDTLNGNLQLFVYGKKVSGRLIIVGSTIKNQYNFINPVKIIDSANQKMCQTTVINAATGRSHFLLLVINNYSEIIYGGLSIDTTLYNAGIAKFHSVECQQDTIPKLNISSCLRGNTPTESLTGNIQLSVYGQKPSGQLTLVSSTDKITYLFNKSFEIADSIDQKYCQTIVMNSATGKYHGLKMVISSSNEITYGYLSADSNVHGNAIAKFTSVKCSVITLPDTIGLSASFSGSYSSSDSGIFTASMNVLIINKKATGEFLFKNLPTIEPIPIKVSGLADLNVGNPDLNIGYMDLIALTSPFYRITVKMHNGIYDAIIYDEKGFVIGYMKSFAKR